MNDSFLLKEQELIKLNKELDVMNKILHTQLKKQNHKVECSLKRTERSEIDKKKSKVNLNKENLESTSKSLSRCYVQDANTANEFLESEFPESVNQVKQINDEETSNVVKSKSSKPLPPTNAIPAIPEKLIKRNISSDGLIKFLKSKVSILQDELDKIHKDYTKKNDELHVCLEIQKQLELQRDQVISRNNSLSNQLVKLEEKCGEIELKLKERDVELISIRKEHEHLKREHKAIAQSNSSLERRLAKSQEDLENTKNCLNNAQQLEKESREKTKADHDILEKQIKMLRKQRIDLITAYKKQLMLIDNLKRQNLCLEQAKLIDLAEKEFIKILDWHNK